MRWKGVRVNIEGADSLKEELKEKEKMIQQKIKVASGLDVEIWAAASVAKAFDKLKILYDRTPTGRPSFTKNFLLNHPHPLAKLIVDCRETNKAHTTFIDTILKHNYKGRIHAEIHQLRSQMGGTVTGRMSYANPNLQQVPARNKDIGPRIRGLFMPEEDCKWASFDYNQQEPRLVVHYGVTAEIQGVEDFVEKYYMLSCSRQTRLLGRWVKLSKELNQSFYLDFIKVTKKRLLKGLEKINRKDLRSVYNKLLPESF